MDGLARRSESLRQSHSTRTNVNAEGLAWKPSLPAATALSLRARLFQVKRLETVSLISVQ